MGLSILSNVDDHGHHPTHGMKWFGNDLQVLTVFVSNEWYVHDGNENNDRFLYCCVVVVVVFASPPFGVAVPVVVTHHGCCSRGRVDDDIGGGCRCVVTVRPSWLSCDGRDLAVVARAVRRRHPSRNVSCRPQSARALVQLWGRVGIEPTLSNGEWATGCNWSEPVFQSFKLQPAAALPAMIGRLTTRRLPPAFKLLAMINLHLRRYRGIS